MAAGNHSGCRRCLYLWCLFVALYRRAYDAGRLAA
nr:MAG TPA: hypothetical protein [Caudoviricetes sp.]